MTYAAVDILWRAPNGRYTVAMSASPFRQLLGYSVAYRQRMVWASVCSVLNKLFDLAPPALIGLAVDVVVKAARTRGSVCGA